MTYTNKLNKPDDPDGWCLIGNSFPSSMDCSGSPDDHADGTNPVIRGTIYLWIDYQGTIIRNSDYASWNKSGGTNASRHPNPTQSRPNGFIGIGQGFYVR